MKRERFEELIYKSRRSIMFRRQLDLLLDGL